MVLDRHQLLVISSLDNNCGGLSRDRDHELSRRWGAVKQTGVNVQAWLAQEQGRSGPTSAAEG